MKKIIQIILIFLLPFVVKSQIPQTPNKTNKKGLKQGKWTILYDANWKVINDTDKAEFYRTITYLDNKPIGKVTDWYKNGKPQMVADSLIQEKPPKYEGKLVFYRTDGTKKQVQVFKQGNLIGQTHYDSDGIIIEENWNSLNQKAKILYQQGNYLEAIEIFEKVKILVEKDLGKIHPTYTTSLNNLALLYSKQGLYQKAEPLYIEALQIKKRNVGEKHPDYAIYLNNLALLYSNQGQYSKAEPLYIKSMQIKKEVLGKKHPKYATSLNNLALIYYEQGQYNKAEPLLKETIQIRENILGEKHPDYASSLSNLASLYKVQGQYKQANNLYQKAIQIYKEVLGEKHPKYASSLNNLAELCKRQGQYHKAESLYQKTIQIRENILGKKHPNYAKSLSSLAMLYYNQGLYHKAESLYLQAMPILEQTLGKKHPNYATTIHSLATLYKKQGFYNKAESLMKEANQILKETLGKNHPDYASSLDGLAILYEKHGFYDKANTLYQTIIQIRKKVLGVKHPDYVTSLNNLAVLYEKQEYYNKAESLHQEILQTRGEVLGKEHPDYASSLNNLGVLYRKQKQFNEAEILQQKALQIRKKVLGVKHPDYAISLHNLAGLYHKQKRFDKAKPLYSEAIQNKLNQIEVLLPTFSENERKQYLQSIDFFFRNFYIFSSTYYTENPNIVSEIFNLRLKIKGLLFQSSQKIQAQILSSKDSSLIYKYQLWKDKRNELAKIFELPKIEKDKIAVSESKLKADADILEKELSKSLFELLGYQSLTNNDNFKWQDVQNQLKPNETLIEIVRVQINKETIKYLALIIHSETQNQPDIIVMDNGKALEDKFINYYQNAVRFKIQDKYSYKQFWEKISQKLPSNTQKIYFSPDGVYHQINLQTLKKVNTNTFLSDKYRIQVLGIPKDLITYAKNIQKHKKELKEYQIYLFGYPLYNAFKKGRKKISNRDIYTVDSLQRFLVGTGIKLLPGTRKEVKNIHKIAQGENVNSHIFLKENASEDNFKNINNPDILHIATHGFFLANIPKGQKESFTGIENKTFQENILLHSGLFFAGAESTLDNKLSSDRKENGILTAEEALTLNLDKTDLVVLSACETGLGEILNGEGVYGLQRAFQQAGAKTVLMSLWKVSDEATQKMMTYFYENLLQKKQDKRAAFRNAQEKLRKEYPEPYYWGAFVMIGE